jgi:hypothetical protein
VHAGGRDCWRARVSGDSARVRETQTMMDVAREGVREAGERSGRAREGVGEE